MAQQQQQPPKYTQLREKIHLAVTTGNAVLLGEIVEALRLCWRMNYDDCYEYVASVAPISEWHYDQMLYEADIAEGERA